MLAFLFLRIKRNHPKSTKFPKKLHFPIIGGARLLGFLLQPYMFQGTECSKRIRGLIQNILLKATVASEVIFNSVFNSCITDSYNTFQIWKCRLMPNNFYHIRGTLKYSIVSKYWVDCYLTANWVSCLKSIPRHIF